MFSLPKLLLLAVIAVAGWYVWRWVQRIQAPEDRRRMGRNARKGSISDPQDMEKCRVCGTYVAAGAAGCGRPDCPYR